MSLERLTEAVPPPATPKGGGRDWLAIEADLGRPLPRDYKQLVETYGPGVFGNFIHIYQPNARQEGLDLKKESEGELWSLEVLQDDGENVPYQLEDPAELLSFARTSNGDPLFWQRTDPADPDRWPVVVKEARGPEWYTFDGTLTEFLRARPPRRDHGADLP